MPDAADFAALFGSLRAVADLAKLIVDAHDAAIRREKSIELQGKIVTALESTLAAQMAQSALLKQVGELEKEVTDLKAWDAEKEKYHLVELRINVAPGHGGALAFALKEQAGSSEPIHFLCPDCYQEGRKSILQEEKRVPGMVDILWCNRCGAEINRTGITYEKTPRAKLSYRPRR
jgi:hypothetical protein